MPGTFETLLDGLRSRSRWRRVGVARALGRLHSKRAVRPLVSMLHDPEERVRDAAIKALVDTGAPALPGIVRTLGHQDEYARAGAIKALVLLGARAVEPLIVAITSANPRTAAGAVAALGQIADARAGDALISVLGHQHLSDAATRALHATGERLVGPAVGDALAGRPDAVVRLHDARTIEPLRHAARTWPNPDVRLAAVIALAHLGERRAVGSLIRALDDPDPVRRSKAVAALVSLGADATGHLMRVLDDGRVPAVLAAAEALGRLRDARALRVFAEMADDEGEDGRALGAVGRAHAGDGGALDHLLQALGHPDAEIRLAVVGALVALAGVAGRALPLLAQLEAQSKGYLRDACRLATERIEQALRDAPAELEAAPAPAGRGTELEAAPVPAGWGTEVEAALPTCKDRLPADCAALDAEDAPAKRCWWKLW